MKIERAVKIEPSPLPFALLSPLVKHFANQWPLFSKVYFLLPQIGKIKNEEDQEAYYQRAYCAVLWLLNEAPENFKFSLNRIPPKLSLALMRQNF